MFAESRQKELTDWSARKTAIDNHEMLCIIEQPDKYFISNDSERRRVKQPTLAATGVLMDSILHRIYAE
jgi:hypothetical protein